MVVYNIHVHNDVYNAFMYIPDSLPVAPSLELETLTELTYETVGIRPGDASHHPRLAGVFPVKHLTYVRLGHRFRLGLDQTVPTKALKTGSDWIPTEIDDWDIEFRIVN